MPTIGKRYFGPHDAAVIVTAVDTDTVSILRPISLSREEWTLTEFAEFITGSDRRTIERSGETRVLLKAVDAPDERFVFWMGADGEVHKCNADEWTAWLES